jgi:hypothetical protein
MFPTAASAKSDVGSVLYLSIDTRISLLECEFTLKKVAPKKSTVFHISHFTKKLLNSPKKKSTTTNLSLLM